MLLSQLDEKDSTNASRLDNNKEFLTQINLKVKELNKRYQEVLQNTQELDKNKVDLTDFSQTKTNLSEDLNKMKISLEFEKGNMRATDLYIEFYRPLQEFNQIVSVLDHITGDKKERLRLVDYTK